MEAVRTASDVEHPADVRADIVRVGLVPFLISRLKGKIALAAVVPDDSEGIVVSVKRTVLEGLPVVTIRTGVSPQPEAEGAFCKGKAEESTGVLIVH